MEVRPGADSRGGDCPPFSQPRARSLTASALLVGLAAFAALAVASPSLAADGVAIVRPAEGELVRGTVLITATAPTETTSVEFAWSADGTAWNVIATDEDPGEGWETSWDSRVHSGPAELKATTSGGASTTVTVTVDNAPPAVGATVIPTSFSPNGDGRKDTAAVTVTVAEPARVDVLVLSASGSVVRALADAASVDRLLRVRWNGRNASGNRVVDGVYRLTVTGRDAAGNAASRRARVRVDTTAPRLRWRTGAGIVRARPLTVRFRLRDASRSLQGSFGFVSAYDRVVRRWERRLPLGRASATLPRSTIVTTLPGVYRFRIAVEDAAGNRSHAYRSPAYRLDHAVRTRVVARVGNVGRRVALTFDDCVFGSSWGSILRTLARDHVKAAFFCSGSVVRRYPSLGARTVRAGHTIGSHGWDHAPLYALSFSDVLWRLRFDGGVWWRWRAAATPYFRPVEGVYDSTVLSAAAAAGYPYTVLWDVDPRDWTNPGVSAIVTRAVGGARPGSIIVLHVKPQTAAALPLILRGLRNRGLRPVGLDELLHRRGATLSPGGWP